MNEHLKATLAMLRMNGNLRMRLEKIFDTKEPVTAIDLRGSEHGKKLDISKEDLPALLQICEKILTLQTLIIIGHHIDDEGVTLISEVIPRLRELQVLHIEGDNMGDLGISHIATSIAKHPALEVVYLRGDMLNDKAIDHIVKVTLSNSRIHRLSIKGYQISNDGIQNLSNLILIDRLDQISITCADLNFESCQLLGKLIAKNNKLESLIIRAKKIDEVNFLLDGIRINSFLKDVSIFDDSLGADESLKIERELTQITTRNAQGQYVILTDEILAAIRQVLHLSSDALDFQALARISEEIRMRREKALVEPEREKRTQESIGAAGKFSLFPTASGRT
jgi:hypothetical protein